MKSKMSMKVFVTLFILALSLVCVAGIASAAPEMTLRFSTQVPPEHAGTKLMNEWAQEIAKKTNGRIEVKIYPSNQLGDYELVAEELIRGTIDMAMMSISSRFDPKLEITYTCGIARDYDELKKVFGPGSWMYKNLEQWQSKIGIKLLGFYLEGMIGIGSTKPVNQPLNPNVDKGVLTRVPGMIVYQSAGEAMGYRTITIPWADTYQALQTGVADAVIGMTPQSVYTVLRDVVKHFYCINYSVENFNIMMSMKTWDKLKPADQKIVADVLGQGTLRSIELAKAEDNRILKEMESKGIKVYRYTPAQLKPLFDAIYAKSWPKLDERFGKDVMADMKKNIAVK